MQAAPQPQVIVLQAQSSGPSYKEDYAGVTSRILGIIQLTGGVLAIVFQSVLTGIQSVTQHSGAGFWCGPWFILAGSFGIAAGNQKTGCVITTYLVLSIIGAMFTIGIFAGASVGVTMDEYEMRDRHYRNCYYCNDYYVPPYDYENSWYFWELPPRTTTITTTTTPDPTKWHNYWHSSIAFNTLLLIVGLMEFATFIWGSVLCCKVICCCRQQQQVAVTAPVQYGASQIVLAGTSQLQAMPRMHVAYVTPSMGVPPYPVHPSSMLSQQSIPDYPPPLYAQ